MLVTDEALFSGIVRDFKVNMSYGRYLQLDQVLSALNFDFKTLLGKPRQQSLDELFWSKPAT